MSCIPKTSNQAFVVKDIIVIFRKIKTILILISLNVFFRTLIIQYLTKFFLNYKEAL